ncbi:hypothetical protein CROQUDRAFT_108716 [Cronartium quercuum f. sp. fusiforme G11]|uniref:Uncharacterized protein n=1 Tax=Cronartium quercuum f. sp. fusiforme G11 TaxID=708437 RepID=A0A9P6TB02_9BASI|nr:hypothetical protein CROQUDRAFT_108716 [Cronartium quercuum f. sp. fusiforme G11]
MGRVSLSAVSRRTEHRPRQVTCAVKPVRLLLSAISRRTEHRPRQVTCAVKPVRLSQLIGKWLAGSRIDEDIVVVSEYFEFLELADEGSRNAPISLAYQDKELRGLGSTTELAIREVDGVDSPTPGALLPGCGYAAAADQKGRAEVQSAVRSLYAIHAQWRGPFTVQAPPQNTCAICSMVKPASTLMSKLTHFAIHVDKQPCPSSFCWQCLDVADEQMFEWRDLPVHCTVKRPVTVLHPTTADFERYGIPILPIPPLKSQKIASAIPLSKTSPIVNTTLQPQPQLSNYIYFMCIQDLTRSQSKAESVAEPLVYLPSNTNFSGPSPQRAPSVGFKFTAESRDKSLEHAISMPNGGSQLNTASGFTGVRIASQSNVAAPSSTAKLSMTSVRCDHMVHTSNSSTDSQVLTSLPAFPPHEDFSMLNIEQDTSSEACRVQPELSRNLSTPLTGPHALPSYLHSNNVPTLGAPLLLNKLPTPAVPVAERVLLASGGAIPSALPMRNGPAIGNVAPPQLFSSVNIAEARLRDFEASISSMPFIRFSSSINQQTILIPSITRKEVDHNLTPQKKTERKKPCRSGYKHPKTEDGKVKKGRPSKKELAEATERATFTSTNSTSPVEKYTDILNPLAEGSLKDFLEATERVASTSNTST